MHKSQIVKEGIEIITRDGVSLAATLFSPSKPKAGVLISSGVGYPKEFYARIAAYGATRGFACLVYDYRGIAGSAPEDMRTCTADFFTWGTLDAPAALDALVSRLDGLPVFTMGHSFGGQLVGLMDNNQLAAAHALIAVGSGYWAGLRPSEWFRMFVLFYIIGPLSLVRHGYLRGIFYWPGVSMPGPVFKQWRQWCLRSDYYWRDIQKKLGGAYFAMKGAPIRQFGFTDDPVVTPKSEAFTRKCYQTADYETCWTKPEDIGVPKIGHSGMFSRSASDFWPMPFDWFETKIP